MVPKKVGGAGQQRGTRKEVSMATLRAATTKTPQSLVLEQGEARDTGGQGTSNSNNLKHHPVKKKGNGRDLPC